MDVGFHSQYTTVHGDGQRNSCTKGFTQVLLTLAEVSRPYEGWDTFSFARRTSRVIRRERPNEVYA